MRKNRILFLFFIHSLLGIAQKNQTFEIYRYPSRFRISAEELQMNGSEPNIAFVGHGYEIFGLSSKSPNTYFGVNSFSALTGIRSGFFVFGVTGGYQHQLFSDKFHYDLGFFIGGGGGSGTPDGGGLMLRPHIDLSYHISPKIALRTGMSYIRFPTGTIDSFNINLGLTFETNTYIAEQTTLQIKETQKNYNYQPVELNVLSSNLLKFSKGPLKNSDTTSKNNQLISLLGATIKIHRKNNFYGLIKLGGAFIGEVDGFAMLLSGIGYQLSLTDWLNMNTQASIGGAGGGNVAFGGGLAAQLDIGIGIKIKKYLFNINYGKTYAPNGNYQSNHLDVSIGKQFHLFNGSKEKHTIVTGKNLALEKFTFSLANRTYLLPNAIGKFGVPYQDAFSLINFELEKKMGARISALMTTNWAYLGDYGAYAEGWVGMQYTPFYHSEKKWNLSLRALLGAGGGGGLDLGSGMIYQYGITLEKKIHKRWSFVTGIGQVRPVFDGNFTPAFLDIGLKLNLNHLIKKEK